MLQSIPIRHAVIIAVTIIAISLGSVLHAQSLDSKTESARTKLAHVADQLYAKRLKAFDSQHAEFENYRTMVESLARLNEDLAKHKAREPSKPEFTSRQWKAVVGDYSRIGTIEDTSSEVVVIREETGTKIRVQIKALCASDRIYIGKSKGKLDEYRTALTNWNEAGESIQNAVEKIRLEIPENVSEEPAKPNREAILKELLSRPGILERPLARILKVELMPYTPPGRDEEIQTVIATWENIGIFPIRVLKATISTFDEGGIEIESFPYILYAAFSEDFGVRPGETYTDPIDEGHLLTNELVPGNSKAASVKLTRIEVREQSGL